MVQYRRVDRNLRQKYGTTFEDFIANRLIRQEGYTWEAEFANVPARQLPPPLSTFSMRTAPPG